MVEGSHGGLVDISSWRLVTILLFLVLEAHAVFGYCDNAEFRLERDLDLGVVIFADLCEFALVLALDDADPFAFESVSPAAAVSSGGRGLLVGRRILGGSSASSVVG